LSFKEDLAKAGKWLRKNVIGKKCYYCPKLTTGTTTSHWSGQPHKEHPSYVEGRHESIGPGHSGGIITVAFCNSSECHKAHSEEKEAEAAYRLQEQEIREKAAAESKAAAEKAAAEAKAAAEKAAAEAKAAAQKAAAEKTAMEKRESEALGMENAGIPSQIVGMWVDGDLDKGDMFFMLKTFQGDIIYDWIDHLCCIAERCNSSDAFGLPRYFVGSIKENITMLDSLISHYPPDMVTHTFMHHSLFDERALEFIKKCHDEEHLYLLYLEIVESDFELEFAYKLVNDRGFNDHPDALEEVINGGNWEAVAVKHGFLQF
jgi:flagellar biosynthesis GTPase FlhF